MGASRGALQVVPPSRVSANPASNTNPGSLRYSSTGTKPVRSAKIVGRPANSSRPPWPGAVAGLGTATQLRPPSRVSQRPSSQICQPRWRVTKRMPPGVGASGNRSQVWPPLLVRSSVPVSSSARCPGRREVIRSQPCRPSTKLRFIGPVPTSLCWTLAEPIADRCQVVPPSTVRKAVSSVGRPSRGRSAATSQPVRGSRKNAVSKSSPLASVGVILRQLAPPESVQTRRPAVSAQPDVASRSWAPTIGPRSETSGSGIDPADGLTATWSRSTRSRTASPTRAIATTAARAVVVIRATRRRPRRRSTPAGGGWAARSPNSATPVRRERRSSSCKVGHLLVVGGHRLLGRSAIAMTLASHARGSIRQ